MSTVIVDAMMQQQLLDAKGEIEFRDQAGNLIVSCRKLTNVRELVVDGEWPSDEELDRIKREDGEHTVEEVKARLRGLTK